MDLLLEFVGGRWRLAEYAVETVLVGKRFESGRPAATAIRCPSRVAADGLGNVFIADSFDHRIRRVDPSGRIVTDPSKGCPRSQSRDLPTTAKTALAFLLAHHGLTQPCPRQSSAGFRTIGQLAALR